MEVEQLSEETVETAEPTEPVDRRAALEAAFDRPRDEQGRFAGSEPVETETVETEPQTVADEELQKLGLRKEEFDHFRNPQAFAAAKRRLEESTKGYEKLQTDAQFGGSMRQAIQPYMATIQSAGVEPATAVQHLLAADHALRYGSESQKQQMFQRLAQSYGLSLEGLQHEDNRDPYVAKIESELEQLRAQQQQLMQGMQTQSLSVVHSEIDEFAKTHEHFDAVREHMAGLLDAGLAKNLDDAYNKALKLDDDISARIEAQQREEAEKNRREEAARKAREAKQAAVSVRGAPVADRPAPSPNDRRAQIAAAFN